MDGCVQLKERNLCLSVIQTQTYYLPTYLPTYSCIQSMRSDIPKHKRKTWVYPDEATKVKRKRKTTTSRFMHANKAGNKKKYTYIQTKDKFVDEATNGRNR